jgi:hypothetical protein
MNQKQMPAWAKDQSDEGVGSVVTRYLLFILIFFAFIVIPVSAEDQNTSAVPQEPTVVHIGIFVEDFKKFSVAEGMVQAHFYAKLRSDSPFSIKDFEIKNGQISSVTAISDIPDEKYYRFFAGMTVDPNLHKYPFDSHTIPIIIEPKTLSEKSMVIMVDKETTGLATEANLPGWEFTGNWYTITNQSYEGNETPYSRAIFNFGIRRDSASTIMKFFLPIMLIIIVSLSSLMMKVSSRLGLNGTMFLSAVTIHWRISDAIPLVAYATFLDLLMLITYLTLVMVLISGILVTKFVEEKDTAGVELVNHWSIRIIPVFSFVLYFLLFLSIMV